LSRIFRAMVPRQDVRCTGVEVRPGYRPALAERMRHRGMLVSSKGAVASRSEYPLPDPRQQEHAPQRCVIRPPQRQPAKID
jgi:hypothetical protein